MANIDRKYMEEGMSEALDMAIKALEQEPRDCKTCIHSDKGKCAGTEECHECMWESKYEQEPCEDAISRQAVLDCLTASSLKKFDFILDARDKITNLPPVTPQQRTGRWIRMKAYEKWGCSECNTVFRFTFKEHDYCPNCGAKMKEVE